MSTNDFAIRPTLEKDVDNLEELSRNLFFVNLPRDKHMILKKIEKSIRSFKNENLKDESPIFYFSLVDGIDNAIGTSMITSDTLYDSDMYYYNIDSTDRISQTLDISRMDVVMRLKQYSTPMTEIGGLILNPKFRGMGLGKLLSYVRFNYMSKNEDRFNKTVFAEMMCPITEIGSNLFWDSVGSKVVDMTYLEAVELCLVDNSMICDLFPRDLNTILMPDIVRSVIGEVGMNTKSALKMLEAIGFEFGGHVDAMDAGPHLFCDFDDIKPIKQTTDINKFTVDGIISSGDGMNYRASIITKNKEINNKMVFTPYD